MFKMRFEGGAELAKLLAQLPDGMSRKVIIAALKAGGEPIRSRMEANAPREQGAPDLADHIVISVTNAIGSTEGGRWRQRDEDEHAIAIGPANAFFYGLFQEYGTAFHSAQPFARPAFDSGAPESLGIIGRELWAALRKHIPGSFSGMSPSGSSRTL